MKFQTFVADRLVIPGAPKAPYQNEMTDTSESQLDMLRRLELSKSAHRELSERCADRVASCFSRRRSTKRVLTF